MYKIPSDLQYFKVTSLDKDADVYINLPTKTLHYKVCTRDNVYFLYTEGLNSTIFTILGINKPNSFVYNVVGYSTGGGFPEVRNKEDLLRVIIALDKECIKMFGDTCATSSDYKEGAKVVVLPRVKKESLYSPYYVDEMTQYAGRITIIRDISPGGSCMLDVDGCKYFWPREALKPLKEDTMHKVTSKPELKPESKSTTELNLFPTRKHYQLNFNY